MLYVPNTATTSVTSVIANVSAISLPKNARIYLKRLEELVGIPIKIISVGADREQTIMLENPFKEYKEYVKA